MKKTIHKEFMEFAAHSDTQPPREISERIYARVRADLGLSATAVFTKMVAIHVLSGLVTLSICPQFGFRVFGEGMGLMHYFMRFGSTGCMLACGAFFTGLSVMSAALVLGREEIQRVRNHRLLNLGSLTLLSLGFFIMVDAQLLFGLAATWIVGSLAGSWLSLELGWFLRFGRSRA